MYCILILGISFLVQWALEKEIHYPSFTEETIILNGKPMEVFNALILLIQIGFFFNSYQICNLKAPSIGAIILNAIRAVMSQELREQTRSFDGNKRVWMQYLDQRIDRGLIIIIFIHITHIKINITYY